ncbi:MAG: cytochrome b5-like heme/steroid binding domain-containing protein [Patescibacteria group bacterium]
MRLPSTVIIKHMVTTTIIAATVITIAIVVYPSFQPPRDQQAFQNMPTSSSTSASKTYSMTEIAQHTTEHDCWLAIDGSVYDVSGFLSDHPGGNDTIFAFCGKDASEAFARRGGQEVPHSNEAKTLLQTFYIGIVQ